ncbi:MAG: Cytochrome b/b6, N-terminal domain, partial [Bryobacterales bacterium]|nr:Cytochrome b/b6, N-terminal domain [Bryobacterales bacterium]
MSSVLSWLEERTGAVSVTKQLLYEQIPASSGWAQVFGSVALFLFLLQAFTGVLLALNYAATPGDAYDSLLYIAQEVTGGRLVRNLHHWGASALVVVVALHAVQVFVYGAYKKPREVLWISGVALLLFVLGFALTGYLLPWDNRAYWGTVVTTQIAGQAPFLGHYLQGLMGATRGIGVTTFSRFYALHSLVLPAITVFLTSAHLSLVRRHGVTAAPDNHERVSFYPAQVFRDVLAVFAVFCLLFISSLLFDAPLERMADPNDSGYTPRPEWYFLFLFQTLKYFQGPFEWIGSIGLPTAAVLTLLAVPFIDRTLVVTVRRRGLAIAAAICFSGVWVFLTASAIHDDRASSTARAAPGTSQIALRLPPEELAAFGYFQQNRCDICHNLIDGQPKPGPTLATDPVRRSPEWMTDHFRTAAADDASRKMPVQITPAQMNALLMFMSKITPEAAIDAASAPRTLTEGASVYVASLCSTCHRVNGVGGTTGPSLNGV